MPGFEKESGSRTGTEEDGKGTEFFARLLPREAA
jgi:hypothetical protein